MGMGQRECVHTYMYTRPPLSSRFAYWVYVPAPARPHVGRSPLLGHSCCNRSRVNCTAVFHHHRIEADRRLPSWPYHSYSTFRDSMSRFECRAIRLPPSTMRRVASQTSQSRPSPPLPTIIGRPPHWPHYAFVYALQARLRARV